MRSINVWLAISAAVRTAYRNKRSQGDAYQGPMTDRAYRIIDRMVDADTVEALYKSPTIGGKQYFLVSAYFDRRERHQVQGALDYMTAQYPSDFILLGAWKPTGERIGALHAQAWRLMPDRIVYDAEGNLVSTTPAVSLADMRDISLVAGQMPRQF